MYFDDGTWADVPCSQNGYTSGFICQIGWQPSNGESLTFGYKIQYKSTHQIDDLYFSLNGRQTVPCMDTPSESGCVITSQADSPSCNGGNGLAECFDCDDSDNDGCWEFQWHQVVCEQDITSDLLQITFWNNQYASQAGITITALDAFGQELRHVYDTDSMQYYDSENRRSRVYLDMGSTDTVNGDSSECALENCGGCDNENSCVATRDTASKSPSDIRNGDRVNSVCEWINGQCMSVAFSELGCCSAGGNYCGSTDCTPDDSNGDDPGGWSGQPSLQCGGCDMDQCCGSPTSPERQDCCYNWCTCNGDQNDALATCDCAQAGHCIRNC